MANAALHSIVIGASGGIGAALAEQFARQGRIVHALSRGAEDPRLSIDVIEEASVVTAAEMLGHALGDEIISEVVVATGFLHDDKYAPGKSWREIDAARLAKSFAVNAIGPALVAKRFLPLFPRKDRAVFAALSARVGSIGDNRLGGMVIAHRRPRSISLSRRSPSNWPVCDRTRFAWDCIPGRLPQS